MKAIKRITAVVKDGKVILDLPQYTDGAKLEIMVITSENSVPRKLTDQLQENLVEENKVQETNIMVEHEKIVEKTMIAEKRDVHKAKLIQVKNKEKKIVKEKKIEEHNSKVEEIEVTPTSNITADSGTQTDSTKLIEDLNLIDQLLKAVMKQGYTHPTPIQVKAIPLALQGKNILATAKTGSGKTAAFALPIIQQLSTNKPRGKAYTRALILSPTRELASQIGESIDNYSEFTDINQVTIYGGISQKPQVAKLKKGKDIIVATPGRLLDLINQKIINLSRVEIFVLDEADRMMDMGFINDIRKIIKMIPDRSQTMLFSATMSPQIINLADSMLVDPERVSVDPPSTTVDTVESLVFFVEKQDKFALLTHILKTEKITKALVFVRTRHGANRAVRKLKKTKIAADAIHGDKSQNAREKALRNFKNDKIAVLVATDIAARGIDIDDITHVINYDMSNEAETYVHRTGRTARAGKTGIAYNFCDDSERPYLVDIERLIQKHLIRTDEHPYKSGVPPPRMTDLEGNGSRRKPSNRKSKTKRKNRTKKRKQIGVSFKK